MARYLTATLTSPTNLPSVDPNASPKSTSEYARRLRVFASRLAEFTVKELRELCVLCRVSSGGVQKDLIARLLPPPPAMSEMCDEEGGEDDDDGENTLRGDEWLEVAATALEMEGENETAETVEEKDRDDYLYGQSPLSFESPRGCYGSPIIGCDVCGCSLAGLFDDLCASCASDERY